MVRRIIDSILKTIKSTFNVAGRASRREFWIYLTLWCIIAVCFFFIGRLAEGSTLGDIWNVLSVIVISVLAIPCVSLLIRRLHDVDLSGFWLLYLSSVGLPLIYVVYLLDLDPSSNKLIDAILKVGSPWLGWILAIIFWPVGAPTALLLICLYEGKQENNAFGPSPSTRQSTDINLPSKA